MVTGNVPGKIEYYKIASGKKISEDKLKKYKADEVRQQLEPEKHSILYYVSKDDPLGSSSPNYNDPMLWRWEEALGQDINNDLTGNGDNLNLIDRSNYNYNGENIQENIN